MSPETTVSKPLAVLPQRLDAEAMQGMLARLGLTPPQGFSASTPWLTVEKIDDALGKTNLSPGDRLIVKMAMIEQGLLPKNARPIEW